MTVKFSNNATSTLAASITAAASTLAVVSADADKFPTLAVDEWYPLTIVDGAGNMEIVRATARAGAVITITRGQEGTTAKAFTAGARVDLRPTAQALARFAQIGDDGKLQASQIPDSVQKNLNAVNNFELNSWLTADSPAYIDFHASFPLKDFDLRIFRNAGVNGGAEISNLGTGGIIHRVEGGSFSFLGGDVFTEKSLQINSGSLNIQALNSTANAHTWYRHSDGAWRAITYADAADNFLIVTKRGTKTYSFSEGNLVVPGTVAAANGAAYINTDGNVYGPRWNTWG